MKKKAIILLFIFSPCFWGSEGIAQSPPELNCIEINSVQDNDVLIWARNSGTCYPFIVFMSTSFNGSYTPVDTILTGDTLRTIDSIYNPNKEIRWYYLACMGNPLLTSDTIDNELPLPPVIKYVSVNGNAVDIYWVPSISPETYTYLISSVTSGTYMYVQGRDSSHFLFTTASPNSRAETFGMDSEDSCGNYGAATPQFHTTVFLKVTIDSCAQTAFLNWTRYIGWAGTVNYQVFASINGAPPTAVSPVLANDTFFVYPGLQDNDSICFTVHTVSQDGYTSLSNEFCKKVDIARSASFVYVRDVSVVNDNSIRIEWLVDSTAEVTSFKVLRSTDITSFSTVATLNPPFNLNALFNYTDNTVLANATRYFYKISALNCKGEAVSGNYGQNMLLTGVPENTFINTIQWNAYQQWSSSVAYYSIFRRTDAGTTEIAKVGAGSTSYQDDISQATSTDGYFYYRVVAMENPNPLNPAYGLPDSTQSFSNEAPVKQPSKIFVPNAFVPDGTVTENRIFKPVILFPVGASYTLLVFDRWGKKVFHTESISDGWDGNIDGKPAAQGVYAYYIEFTSSSGKMIQEKGTVMLVR